MRIYSVSLPLRNLKAAFIGSLLFLSIDVSAQDAKYQVGMAEASIEPASFPFSLALAGYGAPREGRFSLEWIKAGTDQKMISLAGIDRKLYAVNNDHLLIKENDSSGQWHILGQSHQVKMLAGYKNKLYGINVRGELLQARAGGKIHWRTIGKAIKAAALTSAGDDLYMADTDGFLWSADLKNKKIQWVKKGRAEGMTSLASKGDRLYGMTADNRLLQYETGRSEVKWLKIAYQNGITYSADVKKIAIASGALYGLGSDGVLYRARHNSDSSLTAGAMAIKNSEKTVVIANVDLCGFDGTFIAEIKKDVDKKFHIPSQAVLINASHTHFAPVSQQWPTWGEHTQQPDSAYLYGVVKPGIIRAIEQALKAMKPADLYFGRGTTAIGANRSLAENPVYDNAVDVLKVQYADNAYSLLYLTGCHPVFKNEGREGVTISANYPGAARQRLQAAGAANAMFVQGCAGDINPVSGDHRKTGEDLAKDVAGILNRPLTKMTGDITFFMDTINIPVNPWNIEKINEFKKENSRRAGDVYAEKNVRWADLMLKRHAANEVSGTMPVYVQTINIGNWKLVGLSREAVTSYSIGIKNIWPGKMVSVAGYCNDVSSYLPAPAHIQAGTYEGYDSFFWYGQPAVFPITVYETIIDRIRTLNY